MSPDKEIVNNEVFNYSRKMHNIVNLSFFITLPFTMLIDHFTLTGFPYLFTLIWKSLMFFVIFLIFYVMKKEFLKPDIPVQLTLIGIFVPFAYLISLVEPEKIRFLNLTFMVCLAGLSTILIIRYQRMLIFIFTSIISYLVFFFYLNPHSFNLFIDSLGIWCILFLAIIPLISNFNYQRTFKEINMRYILQEKNEEILRQSQEINRQNDELEELNNTKDKFFSIISHDLKNPISSLSISLHTLYDEIDNLDLEEKKEMLLLLKDSTSNLYELLENLLDWSRSQRDVMSYDPLDFDVNYLIRNNITLFENSLKLKKIEIEFKSNSSLNCNADIPMISAVIRNILSNSIKFTQENGKITISSEEFDKEFNVICIKDNGIGMSEELSNKLFRIDKNVSRPGTNNEKGTGLGLILCKEFIEKNGGKIWVESSENQGSKFYFTIKKSNTNN